MTSAVPFITKVVPPRKPRDFLPRRRLLDRLHEASLGQATLLVAGAGFGKTSLLLDYCEDTERAACWFGLDPLDSDPKNFLTYLLAAIRQVFSNFGARTSGVLENAYSPGQLDGALGVMLTEIREDIPQMFFLILDDVQQLGQAAPVLEFLDKLILRLPENCHLIVSSRHRPAFPSLPRLMAQGQVAVVETEELRFTKEETRDLLQLRIAEPDINEQADELHQLCNGWVTGILLGAAQLRRGRRLDLRPGSDLFDYYAAEVFGHLSRDEQTLLTSVSVLDDLDSELCNAITGQPDTLALITQLSRADDLYAFFEEGSPARVSHLFREFLRAKLLEEPQRAAHAFHSAGRALEVRGHWDRALALYLDGHLWQEAVRMVGQGGLEQVDAGKHELVAEYLDRIPPEASRADTLAVVQGAIAINRGYADTALRWVGPVLQPGRPGVSPELVGNALKVRAAAWRIKGRLREALEDALAALTLIRLVGIPEEIAKVHHHLGTTYARMGDFPAAIADFQSALNLQEEIGNSHQTALLHQLLGTALKQVGRLSEALIHYERAAAFWREQGQLLFLGSVLNNLALVYQLRGQYRMAWDLLIEAFHASRKSGNSRAETVVSLSLADILAEVNRVSDAEQLYWRGLTLARQLQRSELEVYALDGLAQTALFFGQTSQAQLFLDDARSALQGVGEDKHTAGLHYMMAGRYLLATHDLASAKSALGEASNLLRQCDAKEKLARTELLLAENLARLGHPNEAEGHLRQAVQLAEEIGTAAFLRPLVAECPELKRMPSFLELPQKTLASLKVLSDVELLPAVDWQDRTEGEETLLPVLRFYGFGVGRIYANGELVPEDAWETQKSKELLFHLLLYGGEGVSREKVVADLWPETSPAKGKSVFHSTLYRVRRALHPEIIIEMERRYFLNPASKCWLDVREFEDQVERAVRFPKDSVARDRLLRQAATLYQGPFLQDSYSDWCEEPRRLFESKYLGVLASRATHSLEQGDLSAVREMCEQYLMVDSYDELPYLMLMKSAAALGDYVVAVEWYRRYRHTVIGELNSSPSKEIETYYHALVKSQVTNN